MLGYVIIALGVGLVICSYFIGVSWNQPGLTALIAGTVAIAGGYSYLRE